MSSPNWPRAFASHPQPAGSACWNGASVPRLCSRAQGEQFLKSIPASSDFSDGRLPFCPSIGTPSQEHAFQVGRRSAGCMLDGQGEKLMTSDSSCVGIQRFRLPRQCLASPGLLPDGFSAGAGRAHDWVRPAGGCDHRNGALPAGVPESSSISLVTLYI